MMMIEILNKLNSLPAPHGLNDSQIARRLEVAPKTIVEWRKGKVRLREVTRSALGLVLIEQQAAASAAKGVLKDAKTD